MEGLTGPMSTRVMRSRTFSMGDLLGSTGGGLTRVVRGMVVIEGGIAVEVARSRLYVQMSRVAGRYVQILTDAELLIYVYNKTTFGVLGSVIR